MNIKITGKPGATIACGLIGLGILCSFYIQKKKTPPSPAGDSTPKIVNIVNFIRLLEPRDSTITKDVLYQTVVKQVEIMKKYQLRGTFLLQYDALLEPKYQQLLKKTSKRFL